MVLALLIWFLGLVRLTGVEHWDICDSWELGEPDTDTGVGEIATGRKAPTAMCEMWVATRCAMRNARTINSAVEHTGMNSGPLSPSLSPPPDVI